jgi:glycosyltransferase involved in cell wall biosynthesis
MNDEQSDQLRRRELPSFEATVYRSRSHRYALVVPVINEGERIRRQLRAIAAEAPAIDVIIADGGSTDGSLDDTFISTVPVRAVLVKSGPGKLSAQLRMAYSWCLDEGYDGIVTIDGNGKDGVEAIKNMCAQLDKGFDYVQGSRYCRGGVSENTPLERAIGNRLLHAPLLSLVGRHWFTDTTNGFRAYSRRYLLDTRVAPFRELFSNYQLLFYLTVRAGQLGFRVCEIPVRRSYPVGEAVPTKIHGLNGKFSIIRELWQVVIGRFIP